MFSFLKELDPKLFERYLTLEKNIKSASNSFYDSYLCLQEQFLRFVLECEGISISSGNNSGSILRNPQCEELFLSVIKLDARTYDKMKDYAKKANDHKHNKEKKITLDTIYSYIKIIYDATSAYASFKGVVCHPLDLSVYTEMFGFFERENTALRWELEELRSELTASITEGKLKDSDIEVFHSLLSASEVKSLNLEEQNAELQKQINTLKDIKANIYDKLDKLVEMQKQSDETAKAKHEELLEAINAKKDPVRQSVSERNRVFSLSNFIRASVHKHLWFGTKGEFSKEKTKSIIFILLSILSIIICTAVSTISSNTYSTFSLFENIWVFFLLFVLKYTCKAKREYLSIDYYFNSFERFSEDKDGVLRTTVYKKKYKLFFILACIAFLLNTLCAWIVEESTLPVIVTILELGALALNIFTAYKVTDFFLFYSFIKFEGVNDEGTRELSIIYDTAANKLYYEDDFKDRYPYLYEEEE